MSFWASVVLGLLIVLSLGVLTRRESAWVTWGLRAILFLAPQAFMDGTWAYVEHQAAEAQEQYEEYVVPALLQWWEEHKPPVPQPVPTSVPAPPAP